MYKNKWQAIWTKKGGIQLDKDEVSRLKQMMSVNAWDTALGGVKPEEINKIANNIYYLLALSDSSKILDLGCGCGLITYAMNPKPAEIVGIDYSVTSIKLANELGIGKFICAEAAEFPYEPNYFDGVLSLGVFMYFPDLSYTSKVLARIVDALKPEGKGLIIDIPDKQFDEARLHARKSGMLDEEYREKYEGLEHLSFYQTWILDELKGLGCEAETIDFFDEGYGYQDLLFHIKFSKRNRDSPFITSLRS